MGVGGGGGRRLKRIEKTGSEERGRGKGKMLLSYHERDISEFSRREQTITRF